MPVDASKLPGHALNRRIGGKSKENLSIETSLNLTLEKSLKGEKGEQRRKKEEEMGSLFKARSKIGISPAGSAAAANHDLL